MADYLSWTVVILVTLFIALSTTMEQFGEHEPRKTTVSDLMQVNLQSKVLVGQRVLEETLQEEQEAAQKDIEDTSDEQAEASVDATTEEAPIAAAKANSLTEPVALDVGTYEQRLCYAILLSELYGPQRAVDYFETLDEKVTDANFEPNETQQSLRRSIDTLVGDYVEGDFSQKSVSESDKTELKERLGFSGELLLTPKGTDDAPGRKWVETGPEQACRCGNHIDFRDPVFLGGNHCSVYDFRRCVQQRLPGSIYSRESGWRYLHPDLCDLVVGLLRHPVRFSINF